MSKIKIFVDGGQQLDTPADIGAKIFFTRQVFDLGTLQDRKSSFTNTIALPATPANVKILGYAGRINTASGAQYRRFDVNITIDDVQVINHGEAFITGGNKDFLNLTVLFENTEFFSLLEGRNIQDLNWAPFNFDLVQGDLPFNTFEGIVWPHADWYQDRDWDSNLKLERFRDTVNIRFAGFGIWLKWLVEEIARDVGVSIDLDEILKSDNQPNHGPYDFSTLSGGFQMIAMPIAAGDQRNVIPIGAMIETSTTGTPENNPFTQCRNVVFGNLIGDGNRTGIVLSTPYSGPSPEYPAGTFKVHQDFSLNALIAPVTKYIDDISDKIDVVSGAFRNDSQQEERLPPAGASEPSPNDELFDINLDTAILPSNLTFSAAQNTVTFDVTRLVTITLEGTINNTFWQLGQPLNQLRVILDGAVIEFLDMPGTSTNEPLSMTIPNVQGFAGQVLRIEVLIRGGASPLTPNRFFYFNQNLLKVIDNENPEDALEIEVSRWVPPLTYAEVIKGVMQKYGAFIVTGEDKSLKFVKFSNLANKAPQEVSKYITSNPPPFISNIVEGIFAKNNNLKYKPDDRVIRTDQNAVFEPASDLFEVFEADLVTLPFGASDASSGRFVDAGDNELGDARKTIQPYFNIETEAQTGNNFHANNGQLTFSFDEEVDFDAGDYVIGQEGGGGTDHVTRRIVSKTSPLGGTVLAPWPFNMDNSNAEIVKVRAPEQTPQAVRIVHLRQVTDVAALKTFWDPAALNGGGTDENTFLNNNSAPPVWLSIASWGTILENDYKLITDSLSRPKAVSFGVLLPVHVFNSLEFDRPLTINGVNYYINRIDQFKARQVARLELIKLGDLIPG